MRYFLMVLILMALCGDAFALRKKICRALALEGGGSQGAYQVGALKAMLELLPPEEVQYDVIAGASVGALNGMMMAAYPVGQEKAMLDEMYHLWSVIDTKSIYTEWTFGWVRGFIDKPSFLDNSPILPFVTARFKEAGGVINRKFTVSIVDAQKGRSIIVNSTIGATNVPIYVIASTSIPGFFPPVKRDGNVYVDGGVNDNLNLRGAVGKCLEITGGDQSSIIIDFIMTNPLKHDVGDYRKKTTMTQYFRGKELRDAINDRWHCNYTQKAYPKINWRYAIIPNYDLSGAEVPLNFDKKWIKDTIEVGYKDAYKVLSAHPYNQPMTLFQDYVNHKFPRIKLR